MRFARVALVLAILLVAMQGVAVGQQVVRFASYTNAGAPVENLRAIVNAFNEQNPDIVVELEVYTQNEYIDKMVTMMLAGSMPDVFQTWAQYKRAWVQQGSILDLTDRWNQSALIRESEIYPFVLESSMVDGRIYGVPYDFNSQVVYINRDWFAMRGLIEPEENWTVDDHQELARKLTDPIAGVYGAFNPVKTGRFESVQWMENWSGNGWINATGTEVTLDSPGNIDMVQYWYDLERQYGAAPYPGSFAARGDRVGGGYAMWTGWVSNAFMFLDNPSYDWGWALYPKGPAGQRNFAQTHMLSIASGSAKADAAWTFIEWMASLEGQRTVVSEAELHPISSNSDVWNDYLSQFPGDRADWMFRWLLSTLYGKNYVKPFEYWESYGDMETIVRLHMTNIFTRQRPVNSELGEAARKLQGILERD